MTPFFSIVLGVVVVQRLLELMLAKRNGRYIHSRGGYEIGKEHYKYIVSLHVLFFLSLWSEVFWTNRPLFSWWWGPFSLFLLAQVGRYWCIRSLGRHWNTRIFVLPGAPPILRGPYRYVRHPNYLIVMLEFIALPLIFSAYLTALLFPLLNFWLLIRVRIPLEEKALYDEP